jgi:hypothetical protein
MIALLIILNYRISFLLKTHDITYPQSFFERMVVVFCVVLFVGALFIITLRALFG